MDRISPEKWLTIGFFVCCGLVMAVLGVKLFAYRQIQAPISAEPNLAGTYAGAPQWVLQRDQSLVLGDLKITYRGIIRGEILLDLTLLQLDRQYAYRKSVPQELARRSMRVGDRFFKVAAVGGSYLKLVPVLEKKI